MNMYKYLAQVFDKAAKIVERERDINKNIIPFLDGVATGLQIASRLKSKRIRQKQRAGSIDDHAQEIGSQLTQKGKK